MDNQKFGRFIASLRHEKNWTQKDLADKLNVTDKAISKWERGLGFPDINQIEPLADVLGVSIMEIMRGERIGNDEVPADNANESITDIINISEYQRRAERKTIAITTISVVALAAVIFLIDSTSVTGFMMVYLPVILLALGAVFLSWSICRKMRQKKFAGFLALGIISLVYPVGMYLMMLVAVCMGLGPVAN